MAEPLRLYRGGEEVSAAVNYGDGDSLAKDLIPPAVRCEVTPQSTNQVGIELIATEPFSGSGVRDIYYSLDQSEGSEFKQYEGILTVNTSEISALYYFADDNAGNRSIEKTCTLPEP